jgi:hypothetical protein
MTLRNSGRSRNHCVAVARPLRAAMLGVVLLAAGCSALPGPLKRLPGPFSRKSADESLRKQAEADSFPTAKQAGL